VNLPAESRLITQLRELDARLRQARIDYALIGGVAVNIHGHVRATRDLDVMVLVEDNDALHDQLQALGYEAIDRRDDMSSYVRKLDRLDVIFARRPINRALLERSASVEYGGMRLPAIPVEGLIGLKVQAMSDDPRRIDDLADIIELMRIHRGSLDLEETRSYFKLFDREKVLDEILRAIG